VPRKHGLMDYAPPGAPPPSLFGGEFGMAWQNSDAWAPRERGRLPVIRHPEVAAKRPSKETAEDSRAAPFEARYARTSG